MRHDRKPRAGRQVRDWLVVLGVMALVMTLLSPTSDAQSLAGSAGTDTSLPLTDSAVTVRGREGFSDLEITVNQTEQLTNQAISITWEGGTPTTPQGRYFANYLQIFQCWGGDDGSVPANPGPPPEQCVAGASTGAYGVGGTIHPPASEAVSRILGFNSWPNKDPGGELDPATGFLWRPFRAVDGTIVTTQYDANFNPELGGGNYWQNPYFDIVTTNEIPGARTGPDGTGSELFEVNTGIESSGLGCGQSLQPAGGGPLFTPRCWLVIVPRGDAAAENVGTPFEVDADKFGVMTSPLSTNAWENRIAIPLDFTPVDSTCELGADERRMVGSELIAGAIASWQPALCGSGAATPYSYATVSDTTARSQIVSPSVGAPGMAVVSRPVDPTQVDPASPVVYAPLALSGVVVGFTVERTPIPQADQASQDLDGVRVEDLNLTPRLVAKLLTQSYRQQVQIGEGPQPYDWADGNPANLDFDPDFLRFNPEFETLQINFGRNFSGFLAPGGNSDVARRVWEWVFADPEAKAWLDGQPDEWGMQVNPVYATTAEANVNGVPFGDPVPDSFPKADPHCYEAPAQGPGGSITPPPLCGTDWLPYTQSLRDGARFVRAGDDRARISPNPYAFTSDQSWQRVGPQTLGRRAMLTITDTTSATKYGIQAARLSRAGDDGDAREFVAPAADALAAAVPVMAPRGEAAVLEPDHAAQAPGAYPLAVLSYGLIRPLTQDAPARDDYARFVEYAAGPGQEPGLDPGDLPVGYAPLPDTLKAQAQAAAETIRTLQPPAPPPTPIAGGAPLGSAGPAGGASSGAGGPSPISARSSTNPPAPAVTETAAPAPVQEVVDADEELGPLTPILALARWRFAVVVLGVLVILSAWGVLEITRRPRRAAGPELATALPPPPPGPPSTSAGVTP